MAAGDSTKVVLAALFANLGIAIVKGFAAAVTGSGAMLAETVHTLADCGNQALLLLGAHRAKRPADSRHPFGYEGERYFWAFVVAVVLFMLGSAFSLYEGVHKLMHPVAIESVGWAYVVLGIAIVLESISFLVARKEVLKAQGKRTFKEYFIHTKDPALPLVYLEDLGALVGLFFALVGVTLSDRLGWIRADGAATIAIGLLLGAIAVVLFRRCHRLLIGEGVAPAELAAIRNAVAAVGGVEAIVDLKTLHVGPEYLLVGLEVRMEERPGIVREIEAAVRSVAPAAKYIAIEEA